MAWRVLLVVVGIGLIALWATVPRGLAMAASSPMVPLGAFLVVLGAFSEGVREIRAPGFALKRFRDSRTRRN